ncbi:CAND1 protein, partial [Alcedo cyanopectus]|nr:CAND1 protein [Ceyx cyanopectus]
QVPKIVKALHKQLKEKSIKSRQGCFSLLTELATVLPGCLADHIPALVPGIVFSLADKSSSSNMRIDTLSFLHVLLSNHQPEVFHPHIKSLLPPIVTCIGDPFYKITSEALLVTQQLVKVIRPLDKPCALDAKPYVKELFPGTLKRLKAADIDQEVKERAISCMGHLIHHLGDHLSADLQPTLKIFLERLKNEITRLTTVKALTLIASSPLKIDLRPILGEGFPILASFLRKNQRALKLSTLTALDVLVKSYSDSLKPAMTEAVLTELPALITENDMHVSQVAIVFLTTLARVYPSCISKLGGAVLAEIFQLVHSPLLQGGALNAITDFFQALVLTKTATMGYSELLKQLTAPVYSCSSDGASLHKQAYHSVAKCVAALSSACPKEAPATVNRLIQDAKSPKSSAAVQVLSFLSLAELGRATNLSAQQELRAVILAALASPSEEVKSAASYALGSVSLGNLQEHLPFLLREIGSQPKRQYLLLHSLKELIGSSPAGGLQPHVEDIWALLFQH